MKNDKLILSGVDIFSMCCLPFPCHVTSAFTIGQLDSPSFTTWFDAPQRFLVLTDRRPIPTGVWVIPPIETLGASTCLDFIYVSFFGWQKFPNGIYASGQDYIVILVRCHISSTVCTASMRRVVSTNVIEAAVQVLNGEFGADCSQWRDI